MHGQADCVHQKRDRRLQAVLALFRGEPVAKVFKQHRVWRNNLYKFHRRDLTAPHQALDDQPRGPKWPHNRLDPVREQQIARLYQRHPTWSSYQIYRGLGVAAPTLRTIQRFRQRLGLPRLPKRSSSRGDARRLAAAVKRRAHERIHTKPYLGPERLAWDLQHRWDMAISPSTMKRLKRTLLQEPISPAAPIVWRFYERHHPHSLWHGDYSAVNHPQTNGKLERAFRDDMTEFYWKYGEWILAPLRRDLSDYVHYRNAVPGHRVLGGKPSITRFKEQARFAAPEVLERLEHYACYEAKRKVISLDGHIPLFSRDGYVGTALAGNEVAFMELWRVWRPELRANASQF